MEQGLSGLPLWFVVACLATLGAIWGSFAGALCRRWPEGRSITSGRSHCDSCGAQIAAFDLIPILSFLALKGKCRKCRSRFTVGTEFAGLCIGVLTALWFPPAQAFAAAIFGWFLLPLAILDYRHLWLPNALLVLLLLGAAIFAPLLISDITWMDRLIGGIAGFAILEALRQLYHVIRRKEGMGAGDPKLLGVLGVWLGWQLLPLTVLVASFVGLAVALLSSHRNESEPAEYPLGTFLALAAFIVVCLP